MRGVACSTWLVVWLGVVASPGCVATSEVGAPEALGYVPLGPDAWMIERSFASLDAIEVVLGTDDVAADLPWFVGLHGYADRPHAPEDGPLYGHARPLRVLLPAAPLELPLGRAWSLVRVRDAAPTELAEDLRARAEELDLFIEVARDFYGTERWPVVMGFSQGGHLTLAYALAHPEHVVAAFALASYVPPELEARARPTELVIRSVHGSDDDRVPLAWSRGLAARLEHEGVSFVIEVAPGGHVVSPEARAAVFTWIDEVLASDGTTTPPPR